MTILIKGGHVINPATQMDEVADVLIEDQKIKKIGKELPEKEAERVINADGCYVMPGFIDMHVHFRDPGFEQKEDIYTGMQAAAHGGYTTVLTMPNTKPVADNPDIVNYVHNKAKSGSCIHVLQVGAVTKGQQGKELADIEGMVKAGSPAISEDGKSVMDAALYRDGMLEAARLGIPVLAHCEDIHMVRGGVMNADASKRTGTSGNYQFRGGCDCCKRYYSGKRYRGTASSVSLFHKGFRAHGKSGKGRRCPGVGRSVSASLYAVHRRYERSGYQLQDESATAHKGRRESTA